MKKTHLFLAISSVFALSACGGGGGGSSSTGGGTTTPSNTTAITVIDGYLGNAEIYADVNANGVADSNELQGATNINGVFELDNDMRSYDVIAKAIAGQTMDSDKFGGIKTGFEFIAPAGELYVTPFSTLAVKGTADGTVVEYPTDYDVTGDYIAKGNKKVHVLARTLTSDTGRTLSLFTQDKALADKIFDKWD